MSKSFSGLAMSIDYRLLILVQWVTEWIPETSQAKKINQSKRMQEIKFRRKWTHSILLRKKAKQLSKIKQKNNETFTACPWLFPCLHCRSHSTWTSRSKASPRWKFSFTQNKKSLIFLFRDDERFDRFDSHYLVMKPNLRRRANSLFSRLYSLPAPVFGITSHSGLWLSCGKLAVSRVISALLVCG